MDSLGHPALPFTVRLISSPVPGASTALHVLTTTLAADLRLVARATPALEVAGFYVRLLLVRADDVAAAAPLAVAAWTERRGSDGAPADGGGGGGGGGAGAKRPREAGEAGSAGDAAAARAFVNLSVAARAHAGLLDAAAVERCVALAGALLPWRARRPRARARPWRALRWAPPPLSRSGRRRGRRAAGQRAAAATLPARRL
jgi:hypothetical protein